MNGGVIWKLMLIFGYLQDFVCQGLNFLMFCGYVVGVDFVVWVGVNGMFYYFGIVFEWLMLMCSVIFVLCFIDFNNDEGGDLICYFDMVLIDINDDGIEFFDKFWIGVDVFCVGVGLKIFLQVEQCGGSIVVQMVFCGWFYVGYVVILDQMLELFLEICLVMLIDCGDSWLMQLISQLIFLNQGVSVFIDLIIGDVYVGW